MKHNRKTPAKTASHRTPHSPGHHVPGSVAPARKPSRKPAPKPTDPVSGFFAKLQFGAPEPYKTRKGKVKLVRKAPPLSPELRATYKAHKPGILLEMRERNISFVEGKPTQWPRATAPVAA